MDFQKNKFKKMKPNTSMINIWKKRLKELLSLFLETILKSTKYQFLTAKGRKSH
jgi:hypothetical protein